MEEARAGQVETKTFTATGSACEKESMEVLRPLQTSWRLESYLVLFASNVAFSCLTRENKNQCLSFVAVLGVKKKGKKALISL